MPVSKIPLWHIYILNKDDFLKILHKICEYCVNIKEVKPFGNNSNFLHFLTKNLVDPQY